MANLKALFHIDQLSLIMIGLVAFVALTIASFSARFLGGDRKKGQFYFYLVALLISAITMVSADHLVVLFASWVASNFLLTKLMLHKKEWEAARQSSILALKNFMLGALFLGIGFAILYFSTKETSIQALLNSSPGRQTTLIFAALLLLAAMTQSALWPFHKWLISSLNSPTPVSALMHAGLINGGGFILARFAPMIVREPAALTAVFGVGLATALVGTLWKLMQTDVKRMLACSTMGQMGFMVVQCGLGLFPAAVAHLCWHGMYKAYLFLGVGSAAREKRLDAHTRPKMIHFALALLCGTLGAFAFAITSSKSIASLDTNLFLVLLAMVAGAQFALPILRSQSAIKLPIALLATAVIGCTYGLSVGLIEHLLAPMAIEAPQALNALHVLGLVLLTGSWLAITFAKESSGKKRPAWMLKNYVKMLNASQPHPKTVTAHRNQYQF